MISLQNIEIYLCSQSLNIREAMARLNLTDHQFQLVIDEGGRLLGTVTDGDIRRAILSGLDMDRSVIECMHRDVVVGQVGDDTENAALLAATAVTFLPVLAEDRKIVEILVTAAQATGISHALVMAGGYGRRLGERTHKIPKPLLEVGGEPILEHVLRGLEEHGVSDVCISTHYLADHVEAFLKGRNNASRMTVIYEDNPLGTAGALSLLPDVASQPILIVNGDVITSTDYDALKDFHVRHGYDATIAVTRYDVEIPFGVVRHDEDGLFQGIDEKPAETHFIAAGIYFLSPEFRALVPNETNMDMPELLNLGRGIGLRVGLFPIHEYWIDVGNPEDLAASDAKHRGRE